MADKKKLRRLFVISNKTHFLNVKNYISTHELGKNQLIFINKFSIGYKEFIDKISKDSNFDKVDIISSHQRNRFPLGIIYNFWFFIEVILYRIRNGKEFNELFISNYLSWQQHFLLNRFNPDRVGLINDGTAIFKTIRYRKNSKNIEFKNLNFLVKKIAGFSSLEKLHFYSPINLEVPDHDSLEVFNFKSSDKTEVNDKKIYFVGSDLVELGFLNFNDNLSYLRKLRNTFSEHEFYYFAHRGEEEANLKHYNFFTRVIRDDVPFEERLLLDNELPAKIVSYVSSVLINLPQVYPSINFYYFHLEPKSIPIDSSFRVEYDKFLEHFSLLNSENFNRLN